MQSNNIINMFPTHAVKPLVSPEMSEVFLNMEHHAGDQVDPVYTMEDNAEILIDLLLSLGINNVPRIDDILADFNERVKTL